VSGASFFAQTDPDPFRMINDFLNSPWLMFGFWLVVLFFVVLWLTLVYWTIADAGRRGAIRPYWGGMAIVFPFVGSLVYLILRPPEYLLDSRERELEVAVLERELKQRIHSCPDCRSPVEKDYILCPECGLDLKKPCENCRKPLRLKWVICPYCGTSQREKNIDF
jgi:Double zinc ribbon